MTIPTSEPVQILLTVRYDNAVHFDGDNTPNDRITAGDHAESGSRRHWRYSIIN